MGKNILRLPGAFLPFFLSFSLSVLLFLLCGSVRNSCEKANVSINSQYSVKLTISEKKQIDVGLDNEGIYYQITEENHLIDSDVLNAVLNDDRTANVNIVTNSFFFNLGIMCTKNTFDAIQSASSDGNTFCIPDGGYYSGKRMIYDVGVVGCSTPDFATNALGANIASPDITYLDNLSFNDGMILPQKLYESYGKPEALVIGWYVTMAGGEIEYDNTYFVNEKWEKYYKELLQMPDAPQSLFKVAGYYSCGNDDKNIILCSETVWSQVYLAQDYYNYTENRQNYYRDGINAFNECGIALISAELVSPNCAAAVIHDFADSCDLNTDYYAIEADDFDYKFAVSQIKAIYAFVNVLYYCSLVFCLLLTSVLVSYSIKKRRDEIYIYRTLGEDKSNVANRLTLEISLVLFSALIAGCLGAILSGNLIFDYLNHILQSSAASTAGKLSRISSFLKNSDLLKEQIEIATDKYLKSDFTICYHVKIREYLVLSFGWLSISLYAYILNKLTARHNLMKRE